MATDHVEARLDRLESALVRLAEAQRRTEERLEKLTAQVEQLTVRVEQLADRPEGYLPEGSVPFKSVVPLSELISAVIGGSRHRRLLRRSSAFP